MKAKIKITEEKPGKGKIEGFGFVKNQELIEDGICPECGGNLINHGNGAEDGMECTGCGAIFTGGK